MNRSEIKTEGLRLQWLMNISTGRRGVAGTETARLGGFLAWPFRLELGQTSEGDEAFFAAQSHQISLRRERSKKVEKSVDTPWRFCDNSATHRN